MDPFATLGLPRRYELDRAALEVRYRELQRALHPDKFAGASASERRLSLSKAVEVNEAYRILRDDLARAEALLAQHRGAASTKAPEAEPGFLMEMMEQREALGEAKQQKDLDAPSAVRALSKEPRRKDTAPVHDEQVAGSEQLRQVAKHLVANRAALAVEHQQTGGVALGKGLLRDPLGRELVVEVGGPQNSFFCGAVAPFAGSSRLKCS